jgi:hypothetical protein
MIGFFKLYGRISFHLLFIYNLSSSKLDGMQAMVPIEFLLFFSSSMFFSTYLVDNRFLTSLTIFFAGRG